MTEAPPHGAERRSALDRPTARVAALGIALAALGCLAWIHWDDLFPPESAPTTADDPAAICYIERAAGIDQMLEEGVIKADQATLFKSRAEALCRAQAETGRSP